MLLVSHNYTISNYVLPMSFLIFLFLFCFCNVHSISDILIFLLFLILFYLYNLIFSLRHQLSLTNSFFLDQYIFSFWFLFRSVFFHPVHLNTKIQRSLYSSPFYTCLSLPLLIFYTFLFLLFVSPYLFLFEL